MSAFDQSLDNTNTSLTCDNWFGRIDCGNNKDTPFIALFASEIVADHERVHLRPHKAIYCLLDYKQSAYSR